MTERKPFVFKFEDIVVRENEFAFSRAGATVNVEPTAFRVLLYLLQNPGRLVTKDEIMAAVWHDTAVSDNSLTRSIATLRRLLDDNSREPRYIATVQTLGYRFMSEVRGEEDGFGNQVPASAPSTEVPHEKNRGTGTPLQTDLTIAGPEVVRLEEPRWGDSAQQKFLPEDPLRRCGRGPIGLSRRIHRQRIQGSKVSAHS